MRPQFKTLTAIAFAALLGFSSAAKAGHFPNDYDGDFSPNSQFFSEDARTAARTPSGMIFVPPRLTARQEHYGFLPGVSNWDPQNKHPQQWDGQDWDPTMWNKDWTPEVAIRKFYQNRYFEKQYLTPGKPPLPVLELGPRFYGLSDLDQRRMLKLIADYNQIFEQGFPVIELVDWHTHKIVGTYTAKGMFLN
ncbi:MAG: hypothetical protein PW788_04865 [Micavibrio sp.]|nr:hypothetical protein [Micavibrio sp.]